MFARTKRLVLSLLLATAGCACLNAQPRGHRAFDSPIQRCQRLRNQSDRTYDAQMGFNVAELNSRVKWSGIDNPPPVDVKSLIDAMGDQVPFAGMVAVGH